MLNKLLLAFLLLPCFTLAQKNIIVFQTDFGLKDGAVAEMKGVAIGVSPALQLYDLTHEIPAYNIWEAAYRLQQTAPYWPAGTVFVSVVDPGVGTSRKSVVLKTKNGQFFVSPDNGTLTLIAGKLGIEAIREIDETKNRRPSSAGSNTFHGRDVYTYTAARLAAGVISFEEVGPVLPDTVVQIKYTAPAFRQGEILGNIPILDVQYGNIWTNVDTTVLKNAGLKYGDVLRVRIFKGDKLVYENTMPYVNTFAAVKEGKPLAYLNSLFNLSFALNMDSFAKVHKIESGPSWSVKVNVIK